jgi:hypothetical protein
MSSRRNQKQRTKAKSVALARNNRRNTAGKVLPYQFKNQSLASYQDPIGPPETDVKLQLITAATISGGSQAVVKRWLSNSAYTPEVGGGSGATPGYARWSALYSFYRVVAYSYEITVINNEAFPVLVYVVNTNSDPGTTTNSNLASNPLSQAFALSAKGGQDRHTFRKHVYLSEVVGSNDVEFDDDYRSTITTSPADVCWIGVGVQSINGSNVTNGISCRFELQQYTRFYDRTIQ